MSLDDLILCKMLKWSLGERSKQLKDTKVRPVLGANSWNVVFVIERIGLVYVAIAQC